jgi:hypothetical protein
MFVQYLNPMNIVQRQWRALAVYNAFVVLCKVALQLVGCVFNSKITNQTFCWMSQLFSVKCVIRRNSLPIPSAGGEHARARMMRTLFEQT